MGEAASRESSVTFAFGHVVGAGIQGLLCGKTEEELLWAMFLAWDVGLFEEETKSQKSFWEAVWAVQKFKPYAVAILKDWEVASLAGKPAVELSYKLDLQNGFFYRAYIDIVLKNKKTGQLLVVEVKTTSAKVVREETYRNSSQAIGYSIATDLIDDSHSSYHVWYMVYQTVDRDYTQFPFAKSRLDKAKWIKGILHQCRRLQGFIDDEFFPMYGENCLQYFRPCKYYGICELSDRALLANDAELSKRVEKELKEEYTFTFTLEQIVNRQIELIKRKD